jgi:hypothetical protein
MKIIPDRVVANCPEAVFMHEGKTIEIRPLRPGIASDCALLEISMPSSI